MKKLIVSLSMVLGLFAFSMSSLQAQVVDITSITGDFNVEQGDGEDYHISFSYTPTFSFPGFLEVTYDLRRGVEATSLGSQGRLFAGFVNGPYSNSVTLPVEWQDNVPGTVTGAIIIIIKFRPFWGPLPDSQGLEIKRVTIRPV